MNLKIPKQPRHVYDVTGLSQEKSITNHKNNNILIKLLPFARWFLLPLKKCRNRSFFPHTTGFRKLIICGKFEIAV